MRSGFPGRPRRAGISRARTAAKQPGQRAHTWLAEGENLCVSTFFLFSFYIPFSLPVSLFSNFFSTFYFYFLLFSTRSPIPSVPSSATYTAVTQQFCIPRCFPSRGTKAQRSGRGRCPPLLLRRGAAGMRVPRIAAKVKRDRLYRFREGGGPTTRSRGSPLPIISGAHSILHYRGEETGERDY